MDTVEHFLGFGRDAIHVSFAVKKLIIGELSPCQKFTIKT